MDLSFLPEEIICAINKIDIDKLYQLRLRENFAISLIYDNKYFYLGKTGLTRYENLAITCKKEHIKTCIDKLTEYSVYAFNESIKKGFLTSRDGVRIGLSGECVYDLELKTLKNITSLNVRIPHEIFNCSDKVFEYIREKDDVLSTILISPPFCGKTTILKDLARKINKYFDKSILIIDERGEFNSLGGVNIDKIRYGEKSFAFNCGVRAMSPDIVITDELSSNDDWNFAEKASYSGVKIIASCHAKDFDELSKKFSFNKNAFDRYVVLSKETNMGEINGVYNSMGVKI
jgi:stage III sporulation protein AA